MDLGFNVSCMDAWQAHAALSVTVNETDANGDAEGRAPLLRTGVFRAVRVKPWCDLRSRRQMARHEAAIRAEMRAEERCQRLMTVAGVGPLDAVAFVAAIGDTKTFPLFGANGRRLDRPDTADISVRRDQRAGRDFAPWRPAPAVVSL